VTDAVVAFGAGIVSFATPCVLPLVPAYLSSIGIRPGGPRRSLVAALPFVAGFTLVFVVLGVLAGLAGGTLSDHREQLTKLSGIVIVAMGLGMLGLLPIPFIERTLAPAVEPARRTGSPLLLGGAFGLCFTPCVTPVPLDARPIRHGAHHQRAGAAGGRAAGVLRPYLRAERLGQPHHGVVVSVVQLAGVDLFFRGKIDAMLLASGHEVIAKPGGPAPDLVIADVNRTDPADVIARFPGVPVLGFGQHTDPQALRAARQAGFAKVVARSVLSERLPELVSELVRPDG
jgi:hypothetical protein